MNDMEQLDASLADSEGAAILDALGDTLSDMQEFAAEIRLSIETTEYVLAEAELTGASAITYNDGPEVPLDEIRAGLETPRKLLATLETFFVDMAEVDFLEDEDQD